jgi:hypothetical protein
VDGGGRAKRIEWENNVVFHRQDKDDATPIHLPDMR